ncbi:putative wall-associated receptor kinase-like 16 [Ipomoea triloba]|uniref:putative wall-associated receptor kinase-like 16 n=1 Tax=Ipomoea triloba TaxID=35885 RepID=UPI00125E2D27|nr:putative wall-associated receptor kinase-like 16 [Ipomoea triloba]
MFLSATAIAQTTKFSKAAPIASPGCPSQCGNVTVPYPFGIGKGSGCAYDSGFEILCNTEINPPRAFLTIDILPTIVYDISDREIRIPSAGVATHCFNSTGALVRQYYSTWILSIQKYCHYSLSPANNLITVGCDDTLMISDGTNTTAGCTSRCTGAGQVPDNGTCSGIGCCQSPIPNGLRKDYDVSMVSAWNHTKAWPFNRCGHTFLGEASRFRFLGAADLSDPDFQQRVVDSVPLVLDWAIGNLRCEEAQNSSGYVCQVNSHCVDSETGLGGYRCNCNHGYEGNPYLSPGCTDIDECANPEMNPCEQICINVQGGYNCSCLEGYYDDGKKDGQGCFLMNKKSIFPWLKFFIGIGLGIFVLVATATSLCYTIKKRNRAQLRLKFFEQNGGFLLKQKITSNDGGRDGTDVTKIYSAKELREATNNYAHDMILGRGGNGTVFKAILPNELKVAVKRSKTVDDSQIEQFINEVVILSRINHRHVVKFLGCCLEAEVPLLVYEYISNGTLYHHIHSEAGGSNWLSWENRLRIAIEAAGALAYLHSATSMPIIHRDVKSTNILIDENYTTKISDFGASRFVPLDRTHVATLVQGTLGYLDPEYFQTSRLTEKSDVYSFGVVLAELLTERKPVSPNMSEEDRNLSSFFVRSMNENRLFQILVPRLVREGTLDQLQRIAELVKRCLQLKGEDRPKMKEVASELEYIRNSIKHCWAEPSCSAVVADDEPSDLYAVTISP